jgi:murein L,D-transpeptidase YafK
MSAGRMMIARFYIMLVVCILSYARLSAQNSVSSFSFIDYQRSIPKINEILKRKEDTLMKQFAEKGLKWPARFVYIRSFKYDSQLEVWVKNTKEEKYKLFKSYKICALAGTLGPKRMAGDYQVPEGFYYINEFKAKSLYHLSLGLNYPNASDRILGDSYQPGGEIYIHGSCVTIGCIPLTDAQIEEVYILAAYAKDQGEDFIPVHIFPVNFNNPRSVAYLNKFLLNFSEYAPFTRSMRNAFYYFEKYKDVPFVMVNSKGEYITEDIPVPVEEKKALVEKSKRKPASHILQPIPDADLADVVDKLPDYPGGNDAFGSFIEKLGKESVKDLEDGQVKTFVMVEYIIDQQGKPVYAKVIRGGNDRINENIERAFMGMPAWAPATRSGKNVPIKLKQTIMVGVD